MNEKVFAQIMDIRDSGRVNMFDVPSVQRMAFEQGFYELVCFIEEDRAAYVRFILTGEKIAGDSRDSAQPFRAVFLLKNKCSLSEIRLAIFLV